MKRDEARHCLASDLPPRGGCHPRPTASEGEAGWSGQEGGRAVYPFDELVVGTDTQSRAALRRSNQARDRIDPALLLARETFNAKHTIGDPNMAAD